MSPSISQSMIAFQKGPHSACSITDATSRKSLYVFKKRGGEFKQEIEFQLVDLVAEEGTLAKTVSAANLVGLITTSWRLGG